MIVPDLAAVFTFLFSNVMCSECEVTHVKSLHDKMRIGEPANFTIYFSSVNLTHKNDRYTSRETLELLFFRISYIQRYQDEIQKEKKQGQEEEEEGEGNNTRVGVELRRVCSKRLFGNFHDHVD